MKLIREPRPRHGADRCYGVFIGGQERLAGYVERWPSRGRCFPAYWTARQPDLLTPPGQEPIVRYITRPGADGPERRPFPTRKAAADMLVAVDQAQRVLGQRLQAHRARTITRPGCPCWSGAHFLHTPVCGCDLCEPGPTMAEVLEQVLSQRGQGGPDRMTAYA